MKLEKVGTHQLKIYLDEEDISELDLSYKEIRLEREETRSLFWDLMRKAKEETGFDAFKSRLFLEVFHENERYVMLITRVGSLKKSYYFKDLSDLFALKNKYPQSVIETYVFKFKELNDLINACTGLGKTDFLLSSSLYLMNERYYGVFLIPKLSPLISPDKQAFFVHLSEFSEQIPNENYEYVLNEHGRALIISNAVERLKTAFF